MLGVTRCLARRYLTPRLVRSLSVSSRTEDMFRMPYLIKRRKDQFEMGGKIGIETMVDIEKYMLAELLSHSSKEKFENLLQSTEP